MRLNDGEAAAWIVLPLAMVASLVSACSATEEPSQVCHLCEDAGSSRVDAGRVDAGRAATLDGGLTDSAEPCPKVRSPYPDAGLVVVLSWTSEAETDLDLHLIKRGPDGEFTFAGPDDCYYGNCQATNDSNRPLWDPSAEPRVGGNPVLNADVVLAGAQDAGNEVVVVWRPVPADYLVKVDFFSGDARDADVRLLVYFGDEVVACPARVLASGYRWSAGIVGWASEPEWSAIRDGGIR